MYHIKIASSSFIFFEDLYEISMALLIYDIFNCSVKFAHRFDISVLAMYD